MKSLKQSWTHPYLLPPCTDGGGSGDYLPLGKNQVDEKEEANMGGWVGGWSGGNGSADEERGREGTGRGEMEGGREGGEWRRGNGWMNE